LKNALTVKIGGWKTKVCVPIGTILKSGEVMFIHDVAVFYQLKPCSWPAKPPSKTGVLDKYQEINAGFRG